MKPFNANLLSSTVIPVAIVIGLVAVNLLKPGTRKGMDVSCRVPDPHIGLKVATIKDPRDL